MSPGQHKHPPISFRPPEADRAWLLDYARQTGQPVNRVLVQALAALRVQVELYASITRNQTEEGASQ